VISFGSSESLKSPLIMPVIDRCSETARRMPQAVVIVTESFDFGAALEHNVVLYADEPNESLHWQPEHFHYIHLRGLSTCIDNWQFLFQQAYLVLQDGGFCGFEDMNILWPQPSNRMQTECRKIVEAAEARTRRSFCSPLHAYQEWMEDAHFDICMEKRVLHPLGPSNDRLTKLLQYLVKEKILDMATSYFPTPEGYTAFTHGIDELDFRGMEVEL